MTTDDPTIRRQVPICSSTYASGSEQIPSMLRLVLADLAADYLFHVQGLESSSGFKSYSQGTWLQNRNCKEYIEALRTILSGGKYALLIHQTGDVWVHYTGSLRVCSTILVGLEVHTWQIPISCYLHLSSNSGQRNVKSGHISYLDKNHGWSVKARKDLQDLSCFCCQAWRAQLAQGLNVPKHRWCACGVNAVCEGLKDVDGHLQINHENLVRFLWGWIVMRKTVNEMVSPLLIDCLSIDMVIGIASSASQRYLVFSKRVPQNSQIGLFWLFWLLLNRLSNEVRKCGTIWSWKLNLQAGIAHKNIRRVLLM